MSEESAVSEMVDRRVAMRLPIGSPAPLVAGISMLIAAVSLNPSWSHYRWLGYFTLLWPGPIGAATSDAGVSAGVSLAPWLVFRMIMFVAASVLLFIAAKLPVVSQAAVIVTGSTVIIAFMLGLIWNAFVPPLISLEP